MKEINLSKDDIHSDSHKLAVKQAVAADLNKKLESYRYYSAALQGFEKQTGITKRQVERYLSGKSLPQFLNLKKIYTFVTGIEDYNSLLEIVPDCIKFELQQKNTNKYLPSNIQQKFDFSSDILNCRAFSYIYFKTVVGSTLLMSELKDKFGEYGIKVLKRMLQKNIVSKADATTFVSGTNRSVPVNMEAAAMVSQDLISNHYKPENSISEGNNYLGFNVFTLDEKSKEIALIKMQKLHNELVELANKSKGVETPFFTVICGDSLVNTEQSSDNIIWN